MLFDFLSLTCLCFSALSGYLSGFIREMFSFLSNMIFVFVALRPAVSPKIDMYIKDYVYSWSDWLSSKILIPRWGFLLIIYLTISFSVNKLAKILSKFIQNIPTLNLINKLAGSVVSCAKCFVAIAIIIELQDMLILKINWSQDSHFFNLWHKISMEYVEIKIFIRHCINQVQSLIGMI